MVRAFEIPLFLYELFGERLSDPAIARRHFALAMSLALECGDAKHTARQTLVSAGEVIVPERNPSESYWADVLTLAGQKSRRTLAALLVAPGALSLTNLPPHAGRQLSEFLEWLRTPESATTAN
jgi:hypothetical protein